MKKRGIIIFGTGEIGRLAHYYFEHDSEYKIAAFTADDEFIKDSERSIFDGLPLTPFSRLADEYPPEKYDAHVALSYSKLNQNRAEKYIAMKNLGYRLVNYICSKSVYWPDLSIGDNCFILENQTIQPNVKIGSNVMIWSGNHIGHGSVVGDHTYISSHVCISGHTHIGTHCFLGVNSMTKDFVKIGNKVFVTMGAMVTKDVEDGSVVVGVRGMILPPKSKRAIKIKKRYFNL